MQAITYKNTKTTIPGWIPTIHKEHERGLAYETDTHFVHFYGRSSGLWVVSSGLTATEKKNGSLSDWAVRVFGAVDISPVRHPVGTAISGVWRPSLYYSNHILQALGSSSNDLRSAEQSLRLLVDRLDELLLYIEPDTHGVNAYSHKTRELLILSCAELENSWRHYMDLANQLPMNGRSYTTQDYVKLLEPLFLSEFEIGLKPYGTISSMRPFKGWDSSNPTQSLTWYDSYNKTKHNRSAYFSDATLQNCFYSIAANLIMFCVRFGPFQLSQAPGTLTSLVLNLFNIELKDCDPKSFYVPQIPTADLTENLICFETRERIQPWRSLSLQL